MAHDRVTLNVGGKYFVTSRTTLANAGRGSMLAAVIDENWNLVPEVASNELFIDRNPAYFSVLLDLLRTGELHIPPGKSYSTFLTSKILFQFFTVGTCNCSVKNFLT